MRVLVLSPDTPYPPTRGGRVDIWRRLLALKAMGHQVMLLYPVDTSTFSVKSPDEARVLSATVDAVLSFPMERSLLATAKRLLGLGRLPWHAATRAPAPALAAALGAAVDRFAPDVLVLEGPWLGELAKTFLAAGGRRLLYRSHNIEHQYLWRQAMVAQRWRDGLAWRLACMGLKRYELDLMRRAHTVLDISADDMRFWQALGVRHTTWLPPLPEAAGADADGTRPSDILFLGNLSTPNNVAGVRFLLDEVMPLVHRQLQDLRVTIVGSNPSPSLSAYLACFPFVDLLCNVDKPSRFLRGAAVLVNPVRSGSGVQLKMLDMLMTDCPIVTCSQGVRGLPASIAALVEVHDDATAFADAVCAAVRQPSVDVPLRVHAREMFSAHALQAALVI